MTWRTVISVMLSDWEWEVSSPLGLSYSERDGDVWDQQASGSGSPSAQCGMRGVPVGAVAAIRSFQGHFRTQDAGGRCAHTDTSVKLPVVLVCLSVKN